MEIMDNNNSKPVCTIPPQRIDVWEFVAPTYGYKQIRMNVL